MITFEIVGKLFVNKDSDKFKSYEEKQYDSGWVNKTLNYGVTSGDNRFYFRNKAGHFADGHGDVFVFGKDGVDANGNKIKGEAFRIPWKERLTHQRLAEVVDYRKFVVDLEVAGFRRELQSALNKVKEGGELTAEEVAKFGASDVKGLEAALDKSNKKRKEFIAEADFVDYMRKVLASDNYKNKKFRIRGNYDIQYSDSTNKFYGNYVPQKVYLADDATEDAAEANVMLFYTNDAVMDAKEEKNKYYVNGYVQVYDNNRKANIFAPYTVTVLGAKDDSELEAKREKIQVNRFTVDDDQVYSYGVIVKLLDGAQKTEISMEDLTEEQQDSIMLGEITLADIIREMGGSVYSKDRITENVFLKPARGHSRGREVTAYQPEDLIVKPLVKEDTNVFEETAADEEISLFDDDDSDLF